MNDARNRDPARVSYEVMDIERPPDGGGARAVEAATPLTRELVAAAFLGTFGALGVFVPLAIPGLGPILIRTGEGPITVSWDLFLASVGLIPLIALLAIASAVGLARGRQWGRWLGVLVGVIAIAGLPYHLLAASPLDAVPGHEIEGGGAPGQELLALIEHHLFVIGGVFEPRIVLGIASAALGAVILFGLVGGRGEPSRASGLRPAEPSTAGVAPVPVRFVGLLLGFLAIGAFGPYLAWVAQAAATVAGPPDARAQWLHGLFLFLPGLAAAVPAAAASRALLRRSPLAAYLAPPSAAVAGAWMAAWLFLVVASLASGAEARELQVAVLAVPLVVLLAFPLTLAVVTIWRVPGRISVDESRSPSQATVHRFRGLGIAVLGLAIPVLLLGSIEAVAPRPERLGYRSVGLGGRAYQFRTGIRSPGDRLVPVGTLDDWTADLDIRDPTAYVIDGVGPDLAVLVAGPTTDAVPRLDFDLFVRTSVDGIPGEYCEYAAIDDPRTTPGPCGPPEGILIGGRLYWADAERLVPPEDITASGTSATGTGTWPWPGELQVFSIRDVDPELAVALRFGERVLIYRADGSELEAGHPLCAYPRLTDERDKACLGEDPFFEFYVEVEGRQYEVEGGNLYEIPADALEPYSNAAAVKGDLPEGMDFTAYRIRGVDPSDAVGLIADERVLVARSIETERFPLPPGLCPYIVQEAFDQLLEGKGIEIGCPSP